MTMLMQWQQSFHQTKRLCVVPTSQPSAWLLMAVYIHMTCSPRPCSGLDMALTLALIRDGSFNIPVDIAGLGCLNPIQMEVQCDEVNPWEILASCKPTSACSAVAPLILKSSSPAIFSLACARGQHLPDCQQLKQDNRGEGGEVR
jgi:hypothetical protein